MTQTLASFLVGVMHFAFCLHCVHVQSAAMPLCLTSTDIRCSVTLLFFHDHELYYSQAIIPNVQTIAFQQ